jgi:hypothetical protein
MVERVRRNFLVFITSDAFRQNKLEDNHAFDNCSTSDAGKWYHKWQRANLYIMRIYLTRVCPIMNYTPSN